ncbi:MAG: exodeoxyribonuclease VII large subunit [Pirellulales bacterium]
MSLFAEQEARRVLSVAELTAQVKDLLETSFPSVWVGGEISNLSRPRSGHCYLTLKDDRAQLRAVLWRTAAERLRFELQDGLEVVCQGDLELYAPRGTYQLVIRHIEPRGIGELELALRKLREKLAAEGLFDPARKRPLPRFPRKIAFVTSPSGAAVRDFLEVLRRRWRGVDVLIVPVRVQGTGAAAEIAAGIRLVHRLADPVDVLVVGRGGGSLEDLWAFNEEAVVRAIHGSRIPVVSAVGHEIDVTLADLVADVRALTPSEAAERVVPASDDIAAALRSHQQRLLSALGRRATLIRTRLDWLAQRRALARPFQRIRDLERRLDELSSRSARAVRRRWQEARRRAAAGAARLESLSPLAVLGRGYSLTHRLADGSLVRDGSQLTAGERIVTRFDRGRAVSRVEEIEPDGIGET